MEYTIEIKDNVINYHPVLSEEEKNDRHQEFLLLAEKLLHKYRSKKRA